MDNNIIQTKLFHMNMVRINNELMGIYNELYDGIKDIHDKGLKNNKSANQKLKDKINRKIKIITNKKNQYMTRYNLCKNNSTPSRISVSTNSF